MCCIELRPLHVYHGIVNISIMYRFYNIAYTHLSWLDRDRLIRYKFRWAEADEEPQDNRLTISEMQDFRHPEQSSKMIIRMAKDIIENLGICLL